MSHRIFDQFEVASSTEYSGSYSDDIIVGNMLIPASTSLSGIRESIGSKALGLNDSFSKRVWMYSDYLGLYSGSYKGRAQRFISLTTPDEFVYDSFGPNITDTHLKDVGGGILYLATTSLGGVPDFGIPGYSGPDGRGRGGYLITLGPPDNAGNEVNTRWPVAFPFENRYRFIKRTTRPSYYESKVYSLDTDENGGPITPATSSNELVAIRFKGSMFYRFGDFLLNPTASVGTGNGANLSIKIGELTRISLRNRNLVFFGFGKGLPKLSTQKIDSGLEHVPGYTDFGYDAYYAAIYGPKLRGYKYGLYDCNPANTKAVFRLGKYGQFRDMLEQRLFSKFFFKNKSIEGVVKYTFISGTTAYSQSIDYLTETPEGNPRDSGQVDFEYRSGKPFFDMDPVD